MITARLGPQIEFVQKLFRKSIPCRASASMFGVGSVLFNHPSYAPIALGEWSSEKINTMLGRSSAKIGVDKPTSMTSAAIAPAAWISNGWEAFRSIEFSVLMKLAPILHIKSG
jgi:hypothetical protein